MYHTLEEFLQDWGQEKEKTERILAALKDEALEQQVSAEGRTARTLAWHLVTSLSEMMSRVQLPPEGPGEDAPAPEAAADILQGYRQLTASMESQMRGTWTDASLDEEFNMYGQQWKTAQTLHVLLRHEIHHRAQLTVLMRQAGLRVPGIYGPAREEWSAMGMEAQP